MWNHVVDTIFWVVGLLFKDRVVAPLIILPGFLTFTAVLWIRNARQVGPWTRAIEARVAALKNAMGKAADPIEERAAFAEHFDAIAQALGDQTDARLARAWHEYHETIVDETKSPIQNTARPFAFFSRATPGFQELAFWSNVFVGMGLVLTFLGIVVALDTTAKGMQGASIAGTQGALITLLTVAAAKFFASIAALFSSVVLRFAEYFGQKKSRRLVIELCDLLERGLLYVSPQLLAVQQLEELKRQSAQLERFNADLAITIGEQVGVRFAAAVAPISASLGVLNENMTSMSQNLQEGLGKGAADAITAATSGELRLLGNTLEGISSRIEGLGEQVGASGGKAAEQIRAAGADFAAAAANIREAFEQMTGRVDALGKGLTEQGEAAVHRQSELINEALGALKEQVGASGDVAAAQIRDAGADFAQAARDIREAFEQLAGRVDGLGKNLSEQSDTTVRRQTTVLDETLRAFAEQQRLVADGITEAVKRLGEAGAESAATIKTNLDASLATAAGETRTLLVGAAGEIGKELSESGRSMVEAVETATKQIGAFAAAIERTEREAEGTARALGNTAQGVKDLTSSLSETAGSVRAATAPVTSAALSVQAASEGIAKAIAELSSTNTHTLSQVRLLADGLRETNAAAQDAWRNYQARFSGVDEDLRKTLEHFGSTVSATLDEFGKFARALDLEMARVVNKLSGSYNAIEEYAEVLSEYVEKTTKQ